MKFSVCNEMFEGWTIEKVFRTAKEIGYDAVEIAPFTLADSVEEISAKRRQEIARAASDSGIEIAGLHWLLVKPEGMYINHPDRTVRERTKDYLESLIRFCGDLGGRVLVFGSPRQRNVHPELTFEQAWGYALEVFTHCGQVAEDVGVFFCLEPLSPKETDFINTIPQAIKMIEEVGSPNFRTMIDIKAISSDGRPLTTIIEEAGSYAKHVHVNEPDGGGPGTGSTDFRAVAAALRKIGYDGYVSLEVFDYKPDPVTIATASLAHLKETFADQ